MAAAAVVLQSPEEVSQALDEILARPEFAPPARSPIWEWFFDAVGDLVDLLRDLLPALALGEGARGALFLIVISVLALAGVLLTAVLLERLSGARRRAGTRSRRLPATPSAPAPETAEDWEERARALAAEGRWREAAVALYHGVLHRLAARGAVRLDAAKTPGDYRRESRRDAEGHRLLEGFLRRFEPLAFGARPVDAAAFQRLVDASGIDRRHG